MNDDQGFTRDPRHGELVEINSQIHGHNERIKNIARVAEQTNETTNKIATELGGHRQVINNNIEMNKEIKTNVRMADKKINQMVRRNFCIKFVLLLIILALFGVNIGLLIWKIQVHQAQDKNPYPPPS